MQDNYISVIVPVYNAEKYLDKCIESILKQTYLNFELLLVDDGSKDSSGDKCDEWKERDKRIKVIHKKNGGLVSAWSAGLEAAEYDWIVFVDSDDWIEKKYLEMLVCEQVNNSADVVITGIKQVFPENEVYLRSVAETGNYQEAKLKDTLYPIMLNAGGFEKRGVPVSRCGKLIRKSLLQNNMKYCSSTTTYEEDMNIVFPVLLDAKSISLIQEEDAAYCYRFVGSSMLHGYDRNMRKSILHVYDNLLQACADKNKQEFISQVYAEYLSAMVRCYANELQNPGGFRVAKKNIRNFSKDKLLQTVIDQVNWSNYPIKFKLVDKALCNFNLFHSNVTTGLLMLMKRLQRKVKAK